MLVLELTLLILTHGTFSHEHLNLQKPIRRIAHILDWDLALDHKHSDHPPVPRPAHWLLSPTLEPKLNLLMQIHPHGEAWGDMERHREMWRSVGRSGVRWSTLTLLEQYCTRTTGTQCPPPVLGAAATVRARHWTQQPAAR